jgi:hypothetical protein
MVCLYGRLDVPNSYSVARKWKLISQARWDGTGRCWRIAHFETMSMAEGRYAQSGEASGGSRRVGHEFREYTRIRNRKDSLFRVDSRSVFFGHIDFTDYIDFADTAEFKGKQKVPHSYSRALPIHAKSGREREPENARFANGVRDDET